MAGLQHPSPDPASSSSLLGVGQGQSTLAPRQHSRSSRSVSHPYATMAPAAAAAGAALTAAVLLALSLNIAAPAGVGGYSPPTNAASQHDMHRGPVTTAAAAAAAAAAPGSRLGVLKRPGSTSSSSSSSSTRSSGASSEVEHLPGLQQGFPSKHYAGYITVDDDTQRQLYYYLVTHEASLGHTSSQPSHNDDATSASSPSGGDGDDATPLILWLTGGPGCSSMDAFTYEHGPFTLTAPAAEAAGRQPAASDIQLLPNPHSWSKTAHILYVDSPAGTGFSYTPGHTSYHTSDDQTIRDLEGFVAGFFREHPWLRQQPLYVAGESYGGVYVPLLTRALLQHNRRLQQQQQQQAPPKPASATTTTTTTTSSSSSSSGAEPSTPYNVVGYIVGNAVTDDTYDGSGQVDFAFGHGLVDPQTHDRVKQTCKANSWDLAEHSPCAKALDAMESLMGPINKYDILGRCYKTPTPTHPLNPSSTSSSSATRGSSGDSAAAAADLKAVQVSRKLQQQQPQAAIGGGRLRGAQQLRHAIDCADRRYAYVYYNSPGVRTALHAASLEQAGRWEPCSDILRYHHTMGSMIPVHRELLQAGMRGLVLSGDTDYIVPYTGTRAWVYDFNLAQAKPWHTWSLPGDDQVAGYAVEFKAGLTFATVKGAGHMVPQTKPQAALALLRRWMHGSL